MTAAPGPSAACPRSQIDPFSDEFLADPFPALARLRDMGPVVFLERYGVYAVAGHEQVQAVLKKPGVFSSAAGVGITNIASENPWRKPSILLEVDPPVHTHNRKVFARALAPRSLAYLQEVFDRRAAELAAELVAAGSFDAVPDLAEIFPTRVFPEAFGIDNNGRDQLLAYGAMVFNGHGPRNHLFESSMAGGAPVIGWITQQCSRASLRPDGLGALIYAGVDAGEVTEDEAALLVRSFLSAGLDTTVSAIGLGVLDFARHPDQWRGGRGGPPAGPPPVAGGGLLPDDERAGGSGRDPLARGREGAGVLRRGQPRSAALGGPGPVRHPPQDRRSHGVRHRRAQLRRPGDRAHGGRGGVPGAGFADRLVAADRRAAPASQQHPAQPGHVAGCGRARIRAPAGERQHSRIVARPAMYLASAPVLD